MNALNPCDRRCPKPRRKPEPGSWEEIDHGYARLIRQCDVFLWCFGSVMALFGVGMTALTIWMVLQ